MTKRFIAMLQGSPDAVPGDYVLALTAIVGLMAAISVNML